MSSLANHQNQSTSAPMSETDNDDENEFDSSFNRQNESMMHKVKDVVSKLLHPSFLFSTNDETDRPKRKRSTSTEEQQTTTVTTDTKNGHTTTTSRSQYSRSTIREDEPQITDDEDSTSRDIPSPEQDSIEIEQQKKRRRTANYQNILSTKSTNGHHHHHDDDERTSSSIFSTDSVRFSSDRRIDPTSSTVQSSNERINRFTPAKQRFDILPTYRGSTSNYDPTKSPLFSAGNRKTTETTTTTTNLKSNEFSANYLLASGLVSRPQPSSSISQPSPATLTHPTNTNRQMFGINYSSINSRRLPYIERLRRRTLQDCIRLNRTVDSEPLSESVIEEHKSTTASPVLKRVKAQEKECGIQCDISITESSIEPSKKIQSTFPPADIRNEALTMPTMEKSQASNQKDSSIQTNSSITIERIPPKIDITKPKVLGDVTPFSWPKFARAQEEYAKKYPEKCHTDSVLVKSVVPSNTGSSNVSLAPPVLQQTNISTNLKMPMFSIPASRPAGDIWKCPSCTKEHPAQTATCSLCRQINPNYKKPSAIEPPVTTGKESVSSNKLPDVIAKEPSVPTPITTQIVPTTTKESVVSIPPATTTSISFPTFGVQPSTSLPITTKESSTSIIAPVSTSATTTTLSFGVPPIVSTAVATTKENPIITTSSITPSFGVPSIVPTTAATKENPIITTSSITPSFGVPATVLSFGLPPIVPTTAATTKENPIITTTSITPSFGVTPMVSSPPATTATSIPPMFGTTATTFDKTSTISTNSPFSSSTTFQPFVPVSTTSPSVVITTSPAPLITSTAPNIPASISFGTFGNASVASPPTTTAAAPVVSTVSSVALPAFSFTSSTPAPSLPTSTSTISNPFGTSPIVPTSTAATSAISFPVSSTASASTNPSSFTPATTTTTTTLIPFGSGGFNLVSASTTSNPLFSFAASSSPRPFAPPTVASTNSATIPAFGSIPPFGAASSFGTTPAFGTSSTFGITPASSDKSASSVSSSSTFGILTTPPTFGFGSPSSTIQTSAPVASTSGFSFTPPTSTAPIFGAGPSPLSSGGSSNPFGFGGASTVAPVTTNLFQFSGTTPMNNDPVPTPTSSNLSESYNPFDVSNSDSPNSRPMLKAKRRRP